MKIKIEHYGHIARALNDIKPLILQMKTTYKNSGLSDTRLMWDCVRQADLIPFLCDTVYQYANDDHINTALKQYFKGLK